MKMRISQMIVLAFLCLINTAALLNAILVWPWWSIVLVLMWMAASATFTPKLLMWLGKNS
jgi:hypothetical protein